MFLQSSIFHKNVHFLKENRIHLSFLLLLKSLLHQLSLTEFRMSLLKLLKQSCHLKVQHLHFTSNLSFRKSQTRPCDLDQRSNEPLCEKIVRTISIQLRLTGELIKLLIINAANIFHEKKCFRYNSVSLYVYIY